MGKPRDDRDTTKDIARDLAEIATHIGQLKGEANAYLRAPGYDRLKHSQTLAGTKKRAL